MKQIVIEIPEEVYEASKIVENAEEDNAVITIPISCISKGILLPDNYGDLIERDKLEPDTEWDERVDDYVSYSKAQIFSAPTIVSATLGGE